MSRSQWKGPFFDLKLLKKVLASKKDLKHDQEIVLFYESSLIMNLIFIMAINILN